MKSKIQFALIISLFFLFTNCGGGKKEVVDLQEIDFYAEIVQLGTEYFSTKTKNILAKDLYADIQAGENLFIIDIRKPGQFDSLGHIEGAVNWWKDDVMDNIDRIPKDAKVICVCHAGLMSSQLTSVLRLMGYNAYNLKWGMSGWTSDRKVNKGKWANLKRASVELETTSNPAEMTFDPPKANCKATDVNEAIAKLADAYFEATDEHLNIIEVDELYELLEDDDPTNDPFVFCYQPEANYNAGHIRGAQLIPFGAFGPEQLALLPKDRLIVPYCYSGQTTAQLSSYLSILGYNVRNLKFGINSVTDNPAILKHWEKDKLCKYHPPERDYPVVTIFD